MKVVLLFLLHQSRILYIFSHTSTLMLIRLSMPFAYKGNNSIQIISIPMTDKRSILSKKKCKLIGPHTINGSYQVMVGLTLMDNHDHSHYKKSYSRTWQWYTFNV